jgi:hypothetical protein
MSLHFHDSLFADFSFAQGKSIRCLCFAQLRTSFRLADNVANLAAVRRDQRRRGLQAETAKELNSVLVAVRFRRDPGLASANFMRPFPKKGGRVSGPLKQPNSSASASMTI